jgi:SagB-type dehydrogenase family enzyme
MRSWHRFGRSNKLPRRRFLHRLAAAGITTLAGSGLWGACRQRQPLKPTELPRITTTPSPMPAGRATISPVPTETLHEGEIQLPAPRTEGSMSLEEALSRRRSLRNYYPNRPVSLQDMGQLFWAAQGETVHWGGRTAPSAGALYPLELYAATDKRVWHYLVGRHRAEAIAEEDIRDALWAAGLHQYPLAMAPVIFVMTAIFQRTARKYGDRAVRYVQLEAGHAAENLLLQAVALGLGAVVVGAFYDEQVAAALRLPEDEEPLYLIPVGHPAQ